MFSPPCTPTSINTKGSVRSPALTTHLVNSALRLNPRSISPVFSHVGDQRSDGRRRAQNNCILDRYHPICPERITEVEGNGSWSSDFGPLSSAQTAGSPSTALIASWSWVLKASGALTGGCLPACSRRLDIRSRRARNSSAAGTGHAASRHLHEKLGFKYDCVDIDGNFGSLTLDINFDSVPPAFRGKYDLTTNHGTTEHVLHQRNAFKMIHDFTK